MPIVSSGEDNDDVGQTREAAGGPPGFDVDFDPNDPETVKVHYHLGGWNFDQRAELAETLAERSVPHVWEGEELVVPEQIESAVDALFEELERELGPFPVPLIEDDADGVTAFELDEWPGRDIEMLQQSLTDAEIPHRWEGRTLVVAHDAEHTVDELLDAIEAGEVASIDEAVEAPDGALHELHRSADQLARDAADGGARRRLLDLVPQLSPQAPPFGLAVRAWEVIVERADRRSSMPSTPAPTPPPSPTPPTNCGRSVGRTGPPTTPSISTTITYPPWHPPRLGGSIGCSSETFSFLTTPLLTRT